MPDKQIPCLEARVAELETENKLLSDRCTTFNKPETPGQFLDRYLIGTTISEEDTLGIMQVITIHSTHESYTRLCRMFALEESGG